MSVRSAVLCLVMVWSGLLAAQEQAAPPEAGDASWNLSNCASSLGVMLLVMSVHSQVSAMSCALVSVLFRSRLTGRKRHRVTSPN